MSGTDAYVATGAYVFRLFDAGTANWLNLSWSGNQPAGASVSFEICSGNRVSPNEGTWSPWIAVTGSAINSPDSRYLQYRATLTTPTASTRPSVDQVNISYY